MTIDTETTPSTSRRGGQPGRSGPPGNQNARKTGARRVEMELKELRHQTISGRTWLGRTMRDWRADLVVDLGGEDGLSTQERALVDVATRTKIMLDQVDVWLLKQPRLVSRRMGLHPVVTQRSTLVQALRQLLGDLGLKRRAKDVQTLESYLAARSGNGHGTPPGPEAPTEAAPIDTVAEPPIEPAGEQEPT